MIYEAVAYMTDGTRVSSLERGREAPHGDSPESAARKWYWRLSPDQRERLDRIILWGPKPPFPYYYQGPELVFRKVEGRLAMVETREG